MEIRSTEARWERLIALLEPFHRQALATARRLCRSPADGDDLYQDTVLRAFEKLHTLRDASRFRSWFYATLLSRHRNRYRRPFWRRVLPLAEAFTDGNEPVGEDGTRWPEAMLRADRAAAALAHLAPVHREAIVLFEIDGYTIEEIAQMQRASIPAVKSRLTRGRDRLRRFYERQGWTESEVVTDRVLPRERAAIVQVVVALTLALTHPTPLQAAPHDLDQADAWYQLGQFDEAASAYAEVAVTDPDSYRAALGSGRICLLRNSLTEAETWLRKAMALKPEEREPRALLGEVLYRRNAYVQAAPFFEAAGQKARSEKMRAFRGRAPFQIERGPEVSSLEFLQTDPLPVIEVTVNGVDGRFLIDTGGWELHVMPDFAEKCGLTPLPLKQVGTYAGGRKAASASAIADRVALGEFSLRNVPVVIPEEPSSPLQVDGIVGTVVLYRFLFTLDYPGKRLILRRHTPEMSQRVRVESEAASATRVPFWLAGDHLVFARGTANGSGPYLFLVDTGMAGGGFTCPEHMIEEANIELPEQGLQGMGGGGPITVYPFTVDLTLGDARVDHVQGLYGGLPPDFEARQGFRIGGLISHDFFRPFAVTFDFQAMILYLEPAG